MFSDQALLARVIWGALALTAIVAMGQARWSLAFVAMATLCLSLVPVLIARWADVKVPPGFIAAVVVFVAATLFLGEVFDFYERFWWWDIVLHIGSAIGFGLVGFVLVFMMFQGDKVCRTPFCHRFFRLLFRGDHWRGLGSV